MQRSSEQRKPQTKRRAGNQPRRLSVREQISRFDTSSAGVALEADMPIDTCDDDASTPAVLVETKCSAGQRNKQYASLQPSVPYMTSFTHLNFENSERDHAAFDLPQGSDTPEEPVLQADTTGHQPGTRGRRRRGRRCRKALGRMFPVESPKTDEGAPSAEWWDWKTKCDQLTESLNGSLEDQFHAANELYGSVWLYSQNVHGCRVVQLAFEKHRSIAEQVTAELHEHVREAASSPHANFVIQRVIEVMPTPQVAFVARELVGNAAGVARHRYGCRILIRLLEHSTNSTSDTIALIDELLEKGTVIELSMHSFGRHVIQAILEHGSPQQRHRIAEAMLSPSQNSETPNSLLLSALSRHASHVLESIVMYCSADDQSALCDALLNDSNSVLEMTNNQFGMYVLRSLLTCSENGSQVASACGTILGISDSRWRNSKRGNHFLNSVQVLNAGLGLDDQSCRSA